MAYNFASAIISYIGLVLGIIIGDMESAHSWVLALTAGMFLYISLVDMVSQMYFLLIIIFLFSYYFRIRQEIE